MEQPYSTSFFLASFTVPLKTFHLERLRMIDKFDYRCAAKKTREDLAEKGILT